jgi:hypothetical protein
MEFLCAFGFFLLVVMVLGHGMWLVVAWMFRALSGAASEPTRPCPQCGRYGLQNGRCVVCGAVPHVAPGRRTLHDELRMTISHIERLAKRGAIEQSQCDQIVALLQAELHALTPGASPSTPLVLAEAVIPPVVSEAVALLTPAQQDMVAAKEQFALPIAIERPEEVIDAVLVHPLDRRLETTPPPREPRPSLADMLQSFMEESNIRWGEILAATLVVLCSVGLVISLRSTLQAIPYFPAILFTLFTVSFHGAGLYTLRRWKLQAVSRVILIISLLLVPLTVCGAIALQQSRPTSMPLFILVVAAGASIFTWVAYSASRAVIGRGVWPLTIGVVGPSLAQVLVQHFNFAGGDVWRLNVVFAMPLACFLVATGSHAALAVSRKRLAKPRVIELLHVLGIAGFALLVLIAVLLVRVGPRLATVARLSSEFSVAVAAALAIGLLIYRRTTGRQLVAWQTAGLAIVMLAALVMLGLVAATWPEPELLLAAGIVNFLVLAGLGIWSQTPVLYVPSVACAALATTVGLHLAGGQFIERDRLALKLIEAGLMGRTGLLLAAMGAIVAAIGRWQAVRGKLEDARMLLASVGGLAVAILAVTLFSGFVPVPGWQQDRDLAAGTLLALSMGLIAAGPAVERGEVAGVGSFVFWLALLQALAFNTTVRTWLADVGGLPARPVLMATLVHAIVNALVSLLATGRHALASPADFVGTRVTDLRRHLAEPLASAAAVSLAIAAPFILLVRGSDFSASAGMALAAAIGWVMLAAAMRWTGAVSGVHSMAAISSALYIAGRWHAGDGSNDWVFQPQHLFFQLIAVAIGAMIWSAARRASQRGTALSEVLNPPWPAVDQVLLGVASVALPVIALAMVAPQVAWELGLIQADAESLKPITEGTLSHGWLALALVVAALLVSLWERVTLPALIGLGVATFSAVWIAAGHAGLFEATSAVGDAARFAAALYAIVWAAAYVARVPIITAAKQITALRWGRMYSESKPWFCAQPLLLGGVTALVLTILAVQQHLAGAALKPPAAGSLFDLLGPTVSYATPLVLLVGVLLAYAVRERQAGFALGGAAVWQLAVNLAYLLHVDSSLPQPVKMIVWLHWNSIAAAAYSLVWLGLARRITPANATAPARKIAEGLWLAPAVVSTVTVLILVGWAGLAIIANPNMPPPELVLLGSWQSYVALGLLLFAVVWGMGGRVGRGQKGDAVTWLAAATVPLIAATVHQFDAGGQWVAFHTLEGGWIVLVAMSCGLVCLTNRIAAHSQTTLARLTPHHLTVAILTAFAVALAIRGNKLDPGQPWWSLTAVISGCAIYVALGLVRRRQPYAYLSSALASLAVALFWIAPSTDPYITAVFEKVPYTWFAGFELLVLAPIGIAGLWLSRETAFQQRLNLSFDTRSLLPGVHATTAVLVVPLYFLYRLLFAIFATGPLVPTYEAVSIAVTLAIGGLLLANLWDRRAMFLWPVGYLWLGAVWCLAIGLGREYLVTERQTVIAFLLATAAHVALTGQLWSYGANFAAWGARQGVSDPVAGLARTERWLPALNIGLAAMLCAACFGPVIMFEELSHRVAAAWGPAIAAWGIVCLAQNRRREGLQLAALLLAGLSAVYLAWAQIAPADPAVWMTRVFRLFMVLGALTFAYGLVLPRFLLKAGSWNAATRKAGHLVGAAALAAFVGTLTLEVQLYTTGQQTAIDDVQVAAIAVLLLALIAGLISLAVLPGRDPLVLSERGRQSYVYAAEACAALLLAHVYVCRPEWFGLLRDYWPFIVMGIAFAGLGAAEIFERRGIRVLSEPLINTGALLPLLPVIGWWALDSRVEYSLLLFITGMLYLALSFTRKSWAAMLAATVAGNGALWALLSESDLAFLANPQLWLIPPALSVLVAAQLNRRRLAPEALAGVRYAATTVIYVSSTSEIFVRDFAAGLWPPMVLLGLAVAGALVGIALRVRAFLFLGMSFTVVALIAMVRHAAHEINDIWPWWVFGIALGVSMLVLLGVFEKKRTEVTMLIARLRQWEQ